MSHLLLEFGISKISKKNSLNDSSKKTQDTNSHNSDNDFVNEEDYNDNYWLTTESKQRKIPITPIHMKYKKTNNEITDRVFDIESFSRGDKGYYIFGFCHKRNKNLKLSSLGIIDPIDNITGEKINNITLYIEEKYKNTKEYRQDLIFDKYGCELYCLLYLASTSGSVVKNERDIIRTWIKSLNDFVDLDDEWIDTMLKELYRPGKMEIRNWVKDSIKKGTNLKTIFPAIEQLSHIQNKNNTEFKAFVNYLNRI